MSPAAAPVPSFTRHVPALDGVRGIAILLVLAHNFNLLGDGPMSWAAKAVNLVMDVGWTGVQLFFVLSGYLITGILLDTRQASNYWPAFLGRRALRIFPLYYAVLFAAFVVGPVLGYTASGAEHQIWLWIYLANWAEPFGRWVSIFPHLWSLSIEEQFYLVWPAVVRRRSPRDLGVVCGVLAVGALVARVALRASDWQGAAQGAYMFTICRVDALALGAWAALAVRSTSTLVRLEARRALLRWIWAGLLIVTILITRGAPRAGILTQTYGYTLFAICFTALVLDVALAPADGWLNRVLAFAPLRAVGRYSYAMYVFHTPLHFLAGLPLIERITGGAPAGVSVSVGYFIAATSLTFVAAAASYHLLEKHFLALKPRLKPGRESPVKSA